MTNLPPEFGDPLNDDGDAMRLAVRMHIEIGWLPTASGEWIAVASTKTAYQTSFDYRKAICMAAEETLDEV